MNEANERKTLSKDHKNLAKNTVYAFLVTYSNYFGSLITSIVTARLITKDLWGVLILATSFITIIALISTFLPPGLGSSLNYYIPRYLALDQIPELKSYIKNVIYIRLITLFATFIVGLSIFLLFTDYFRPTLDEYTHLLIILSPIIILSVLEPFLNDINRGLNLFKIVFILTITKFITNIGALLFFLLSYNSIQIEILALINVISLFIPLVVSSIIIAIFLRFKLKIMEKKKVTLREIIKNSGAYGTHVSINSFVNKLFTQLRVQGVGIFESPDIVTGYNLANHYREVSTGSVNSLSKPLVISISGFHAKNEFDQIKKIYIILFKYVNFFFFLLTGILFFFTDFFLFLFTTETENYINYSIIVKLVIISAIFYFERAFFINLLKGSGKIKYLIPLSLFFQTINLISFFIGLIIFGVEGAIVGGMVAAFINFLVVNALSFKFFQIRLSILKSIFQFASFFIALGITVLLEQIAFKNLNYLILMNLNLLFFQNFNVFSITLFVLIYLASIILFRIFTRSDIENLEALFYKTSFTYRVIRRVLYFLKRFTKT